MTPLRVVGQKELEELRAFLKAADLPYEDISLEGNEFTLYTNGDAIVGSGGLEFYGDHCLLRSVAVAPALRNKGLGELIVLDLIARATMKRVQTISLLTETAQAFFGKRGFERQDRGEAPKEIQASSEFSSVCPVSAVLMTRTI
jgi:amino-acid N-acetyltransferase